MAIPVINTTQSILALSVGQQFLFKLIATESPTSWSIGSNAVLPTGFTLNASTGVISGYGTTPGIWSIPVTASNSSGSSSSVTFTIGVFQTSKPTAVYRDISIDVYTRIATLPNPQTALTITGDNSFAIPESGGFEMYGDDVLWRILFTQCGQAISPSIISAKMSLKGTDDSDPFFITNLGAFTQSAEYVAGVYTSTNYLYFSLISDGLLNYISQFESPTTTEANCIGEIEFEMIKPTSAPGPDVLKITTKPFVLRVRRDTVR